MTGRRWRRKHADDSTDAKLERAQESLDKARAQHAEQSRKREDEHERLMVPMDWLEEGNHLAALVYDVFTGNGGHT